MEKWLTDYVQLGPCRAQAYYSGIRPPPAKGSREDLDGGARYGDFGWVLIKGAADMPAGCRGRRPNDFDGISVLCDRLKP